MPAIRTPVLAIIVPCYNEEEVLPVSCVRLKEKLDSLKERGLVDAASRIYFVDDGSSDSTWQIISGLVESDSAYEGIKLTRNYGHQYAVYAGLMNATGDALITIDADLQDDINAIDDMVVNYRNGDEIVYGVRDDRHTDGVFKRWTASWHYWIAARFGIETIPNHADFRLLSKQAIGVLSQYKEKNLYLRGMIPLIGLQSSKVHYARGVREAGESKYGFKEMLALSVQGITSLSIMPLRVIAVLGFVVFIVSTGLGGWALWAKLTGNSAAIDGWASTVIPIYLLGGLQLLAIGVAGEYIGKTYMEVKRRPNYQIEQIASRHNAQQAVPPGVSSQLHDH